MKEKNSMITKDMMMGDIVKKYPETMDYLIEVGVHNADCNTIQDITLEESIKQNGKNTSDMNKFVSKLNEIVVKNMENKSKNEDKNSSQAKITITKKAAAKIKELIKNREDKGLRIAVIPGGCSGFKYVFGIGSKSLKNDVVIDEKGARVFIDKESIEKINKSNLDYIDSLSGAGFKIENPNATKSCGCGSSFR